MQALAFPFRLNRRKAITLDSESDAYIAQKVATVVSTRTGELPLLPLFGTTDPEFNEFDAGGLYYTCAIFFPEVEINNIGQELDETGRTKVNIEFDVIREDPNNGYPGSQ